MCALWSELPVNIVEPEKTGDYTIATNGRYNKI